MFGFKRRKQEKRMKALEVEISQLEKLKQMQGGTKEMVFQKMTPPGFGNKKALPEMVEVEQPVKKQTPKEEWQVVAKIPVQEIRRYVRESDGMIINLITTEEYLTQQANGGS